MKLIFSVIFTTMTLAAFAEEQLSFRFDGELKLDTIYTSKPSADTGKTEFKLPALKLNLEKDLTKETYVRGSVQLGPSRIAVIGQNNVGQFHAVAEEAYIAAKNFLAQDDLIRYGLVTHPWIDLVNDVWFYGPYTDGGAVLLDRLNYTFRADLGISYKYNFSNQINATFWILNGEGILRDETYASKDVGLMLNYYLSKSEDSYTLFALAYAGGKYDSFLSSVNQKERSHLLLAFVRKTGLSFGIEGFQGKDPVDGITQMQNFGIDVANGADLSSKGGLSATSTGGAFYSRYSFENAAKKKYELLLKGEYLMPISTLPLWTWLYMSGLAYAPNEKMTFMLANNHYLYSEGNFGSSRRETDKTYLTLRAVF